MTGVKLVGKSIDNYVSNVSSVVDKNIMTVEHRSNNPKRDYLFCNKKQGKHIPVVPSMAIFMYDYMVYAVERELKKTDKVVVVGFAETATAIGAYISSHLENCVYHLQTTRENCASAKRLIEFSEEHSHATEQYLYGDLDRIPEFNYILFVEDEISTGKTILNFISEFKKIKNDVKFGVVSVCNWQSKENRELYKTNGIQTFNLIRGELDDANAKMDAEVLDVANDYAGNTIDVNTKKCMIGTLNGTGVFERERTGRDPNDPIYERLAERIAGNLSEYVKNCEDILVLGTEEFMYIPINVGDKLAFNLGINVHTHSTTRSSIDVMKDNDGDIHNGIVNKFKLHSAYDENRDTYIYNLRKYDKVIIITDGKMPGQFIKDITAALVSVGNTEEKIIFIKIET